MSDAGVSLNEIIVGMGFGFGLPRALVGTKPASAKGHSNMIGLKLACKKNGNFSELTLKNQAKIKSSLLKVKKSLKWIIIPGRESNKNLHGKIAI